jgi:hypothetical protein
VVAQHKVGRQFFTQRTGVDVHEPVAIRPAHLGEYDRNHVLIAVEHGHGQRVVQQ